MRYLKYVLARYLYTALSKLNAVIATKIKAVWTFNLLNWSLRRRDEYLIRESKYCMLRVIFWQEKAKKCIIAHHQYEKELKNEEKENK